MYWDAFTNICLFVTYFAVPYNIAFDLPEVGDQNATSLELFLDVVIFVDIIISFFTDDYPEPGTKPTNIRIAQQYAQNYFVFDALSCMPGLFQGEIGVTGSTLSYKLKLFRLL